MSFFNNDLFVQCKEIFNNFITALFDKNIYALSFVFGCAVFFLVCLLYLNLRFKKIADEKIEALSFAIRCGINVFLNYFNRIFLVVSILAGFVIFKVFGLVNLASFIGGIIVSYVSIIIGVKSVGKGEGRVVIGAKTDESSAFSISFMSGSISGLAFSSLSLIVISLIMYRIGDNLDIMNSIIAFALGVALTTLFVRTVGGMYAKSADISSYLLQESLVDKCSKNCNNKSNIKSENTYIKDKSDNLSLSYIADNIGDCINNIAGLGMDILEANISAVVSSIIIASTITVVDISRYISVDITRDYLIFLPVIISAIGLLSSLIGIFAFKFVPKSNPKKTLDILSLFTSVIFCLIVFAVIYFMYPLKLFIPVLSGALVGFLISKLTDMFTNGVSIRHILSHSKTTPAGNIIAGISSGFYSIIIPVILLISTMFISFKFAGLYGISLAALGLISTFAFVLTISSGGPVSDNAHSISIMSLQKESVNKITANLDILGNTSAVMTKAIAISASILTSLALFAAYKQQVEFFAISRVFIDVININTLIGLFIGALIVIMAIAYIVRSVEKMADLMLDWLQRSSFGICEIVRDKVVLGKNPIKNFVMKKKEYKQKLELVCENVYGFCVYDIKGFMKKSTLRSFRYFIIPLLFIIFIPVLVYIMGVEFVAGVMISSFIFGTIISFFMYNTGGIWDNAKKAEYLRRLNNKKSKDNDNYLNDNILVGDIVGDYFKDAIGPFVNIIVKLISVIALVIAPLMLK